MRRAAARCAAAVLATALAAPWLQHEAHAQSPGPGPGSVPEWSRAARLRLQGPDTAAAEIERQSLLTQAETALAGGKAASAQALLERAALMLHAPDTESGLVRAYMQAGEYRRALAFAAHAAGAHRREWPAGMALYAWLLQVGGQSLVAQRMLETALQDAPSQPELVQAAHSLLNPWPRPESALLQGLLRLAPYAVGAQPPAGAHSAGSAVLLPSGAVAVAPAALVNGAGRVWLRNGLGRTVAAVPEGPPDALGLQRLRLLQALPAPATPAARRAPFAGSPGYLLEYPESPDQPAWPLLRQGFFGRAGSGDTLRPLGLELPPGPRGGPVFDAQGHWVGMALRAADGSARLVDLAALQQADETATAAVIAHVAPTRASADAVYEQGLTQALQLLR